MSTNVLEKDITDLFGLDEMSEDERATFLEDVGNLILESTVTRLMSGMEEAEKKSFEQLVSEVSGQEDMIEQIEKQYPKFTELFTEEVEAFKKEAIAVLGAEASDQEAAA